jgi:hypothetical protein
VRFAEALLTEPDVLANYNDAFLLPPVMTLQQFNQPGPAGAVIAVGITTVLNAPPAVCRWALNRALAPGRWFANDQNCRVIASTACRWWTPR